MIHIYGAIVWSTLKVNITLLIVRSMQFGPWDNKQKLYGYIQWGGNLHTMGANIWIHQEWKSAPVVRAYHLPRAELRTLHFSTYIVHYIPYTNPRGSEELHFPWENGAQTGYAAHRLSHAERMGSRHSSSSLSGPNACAFHFQFESLKVHHPWTSQAWDRTKLWQGWEESVMGTHCGEMWRLPPVQQVFRTNIVTKPRKTQVASSPTPKHEFSTL